MHCVQNINEAEDFAKMSFPDLARSHFAVASQGYHSFTFLVGEKDVVRIAREPWIAQAMVTEAAILENIFGKLSLPTPKLHSSSQPERGILRMSKLPGEMLVNEVLESLPKKEQLRLAKLLGKFIANLHTHLKADRSLLKGAFVEDRKKAHNILETLSQRETAFSLKPIFDNALNYLSTYEHDQVDDVSLIHNDLKGQNILYDRSTGQLSIIDWTLIQPGRRHQEFIKFITEYPKSFGRWVMASYERETKSKIKSKAETWTIIAEAAGWALGRQNPSFHPVIQTKFAELAHFYKAPTLQDLPATRYF